MATIIKFKRRASGGAPGAPAALKSGEPAYNEVDGVLYYGFGDDGSGNATSVIPMGGSGAFVGKTGAETIAGVKTFSSAPVVPTPAAAGEAANKAYVDAAPFLPATTPLSAIAAPVADLGLAGRRITNLGTPTAAADAVTKAYVDGIAQGLQWKQPCRAATTATIALSGEQTVDGVACVAGDRVLVKDQTAAANNGIYIVATGAWTRAVDFDASNEVLAGTTVLVTEGTANAKITFTLATSNPIVLGATALSFVQITGGASGEANTASNVGATGVGVFHAKSGVELQFRKLDAASGSPITVTLNANKIDLALPTIDGGAF